MQRLTRKSSARSSIPVRIFTSTLIYVALAKRSVIADAPEMRCSRKVSRYSIILTTMAEHRAPRLAASVYLHTLVKHVRTVAHSTSSFLQKDVKGPQLLFYELLHCFPTDVMSTCDFTGVFFTRVHSDAPGSSWQTPNVVSYHCYHCFRTTYFCSEISLWFQKDKLSVRPVRSFHLVRQMHRLYTYKPYCHMW